MAFALPLTQSLRKARWKVKIRDKEAREPPHVTIIRGTVAWRIGLRSGEFMENEPDPAEGPGALIDLIRGNDAWPRLCDEWDRMYPKNLVSENATEE